MKKTFYNETFEIKFSLKISDVPYANFNGRGVTYLNNGEEVINIIISPNEPVGTLVHEIVHAVDFMYDAMGIERSAPTDEPFAYMAGWLTNKMLPIFLKHKTQKK